MSKNSFFATIIHPEKQGKIENVDKLLSEKNFKGLNATLVIPRSPPNYLITDSLGWNKSFCGLAVFRPKFNALWPSNVSSNVYYKYNLNKNISEDQRPKDITKWLRSRTNVTKTTHKPSIQSAARKLKEIRDDIKRANLAGANHPPKDTGYKDANGNPIFDTRKKYTTNHNSEAHIRARIHDVDFVFASAEVYQNETPTNGFNNRQLLLYAGLLYARRINQKRTEVLQSAAEIEKLVEFEKSKKTFAEDKIKILRDDLELYGKCLEKLQRQEPFELEAMAESFAFKSKKYDGFVDSQENRKTWLEKNIRKTINYIEDLKQEIVDFEQESGSDDESIRKKIIERLSKKVGFALYHKEAQQPLEPHTHKAKKSKMKLPKPKRK